MEKLGKKSAVLAFSNVTTLAISMIISMIVARYRTLEENGTYTQIMLIIHTVMPFVILGIPNSITYFIGKSESKQSRNDYIGNYYTLIYLICIVVGIVLYALSPIIAQRYNNNLILALRYMFLIFPLCLQSTSTISDILISCGKVRTLLVYRLLYSFSLLAINIMMVLMKWSFNTYILLYTLVLLTLSIVVVVINLKFIKIGRLFFFNIELTKEILKFSIPLGLATVIGTLSLEFDKLFISMKFSTEVLGMYNYVAKELPIVAVTNSVTSILLPSITRMISKGQTDKSVSVWNNATIITFSITAFFTCGVFTYAPQVISILYSDKYLPGLTIFRIYTLTILLRFTYFGIFFNANGKAKKIMYYSLFGLASNIVLNYIFFYIFGINGPAIATVVSLYLTDYLELIGTKKLLHMRMRDLLPWVSFIKIIVLNIVLSVVFYIAKTYLHIEQIMSDNGESLFLAVIWACVYFLIIKNKIIPIWKKLNRTEV